MSKKQREYVLPRVERRAGVKIIFDLKNADPRPVPAWSQPGSYLPDRVTIEYQAADDKPGTRMRVVLHSATLYGYRLKKDGTPGRVRENEYWLHMSLEDAPAVVREAVALAVKLMDDADAKEVP